MSERLALDSLPTLDEDVVLNALLETFNARILQAETDEAYIGNLTTRVRLGEDDYLTLPTVRLVIACHKTELERGRASMFAHYLLNQGAETARDLWQRAEPWEGPQFMAWVREDIAFRRGDRS